MYTYGGQVHDKVWGLNLGALRWTQHQCTGYIPFARSHHSAVQYSNYMVWTHTPPARLLTLSPYTHP